MANCGPNDEGEGIKLGQATSEEAQRGTKRPAEAAELDQEVDLKHTPVKLRDWPEKKPLDSESDVDDSESGVDDSESGVDDSPVQAISQPTGSRNAMEEIASLSPEIYIDDIITFQEPHTSSSESEELQYCLVSEESEIKPALAKLRERSEEHPFLAIDCEGENLSRRGQLSIVSVATHSHTYLFDVVALGAKVFDEGLKELLEDPGREKLMFDCRADSDCLWHLHKVRLTNVVDLQLLEFIGSHQTITTRSHINGYRKCLDRYVCNAKLTKIKDEGAALMGKGGAEWMKRPLQEKLLKYAAVDVQGFFKLYDKLKEALNRTGEKARLQLGSQRYLDLYREKLYRTYDKYEHNSYLPRRVLDDRHYRQQRTCQGCKRKFPKFDFNRSDKCPVCARM